MHLALVPRQVIIDSLICNWGRPKTSSPLVSNIYEGSCKLQVLTDEGPTPPIALKERCVKQGCPLSGILFNIAIDPVLRSVQEHKGHRAILAFADDLVLLAETADELQEMIQLTSDELSLLCLQLNPAKCATIHLAGTNNSH
ncbi:retrovirus-related Pol polyprotein from type-1 retrotransposable element R2 [Trichonephila clavipes]|nr:retrovirus-related Pol polyprotein from type-1 retrotransposable element R2 [Trichonephila clavipes]